eukprot:TRINITY_DN1188_c0_g1_i4.p1 TRINITY_DN1188_c0_g1~~TRINITY_DN1188_c0_g1_i4.p1  ORF type:complete len:154 (+),score=22.10 TRINITY_DN1188_c0_g1_i4:322-783(+)
MDEGSGLQLDGTLEIYSEVAGSTYNLLHMHVEDVSRSASIKVICIGDKESANDHKVFEKDTEGNSLRYKILVKDGKVETVLYNTGTKIESIKFKEIQFSSNELGMLLLISLVYIEERKAYAKVISIPPYLLSAKTSVHFFTKSKGQGLRKDRF